VTRLPGDVLALPAGDGRWVLMNVFTRTCLGVDRAMFDLLGWIAQHGQDLPGPAFPERRFPVWAIEWFSNEAGLLADPTRYRRDAAQWPEAEQLTAEAAVERLKRHFLLIDDARAYEQRFAPKTTLADWDHVGNFHQQLGQHLMLLQRVDPNKWWLAQKFEADFVRVRDTLYKAVQEHSLRGYFSRRFSPGADVVDIGCGTGFYSNLIAGAGARVLGVDPSRHFVDIARQHAAPGARYEVLPAGSPGGLDSIPTASADFVFMSDALLFYFVPATPTQVADLDVLLRDIRRILRPQGSFISVEPHPTYWLAPWLGDVRRPFTVLTEHLTRAFSVTPTIAQFIQSVTQRGFAVTWMDELRPDPAFAEIDERAFHFARQFPLWQLFEMTPRSSTA
jgi:SAM-dependent methyltransferase